MKSPVAYHSKILAMGSAFPKKRLTNHDLAKIVDTSDEWIFERTGIRARRIADIKGGDSNSGFAFEAAKKALNRAKLEPGDLDMILYATVSPDRIIPTVSCILHEKLGLKFPLLADYDYRITDKYGVMSFTGHPKRAVFLIGQDGRVLYEHVEKIAVTHRSAKELLQEIDKISN